MSYCLPISRQERSSVGWGEERTPTFRLNFSELFVGLRFANPTYILSSLHHEAR